MQSCFKINSKRILNIWLTPGIQPFVESLLNFQMDWRESLFNVLCESLVLFVKTLHKTIEEKINDQDISIEQVLEELKKKECDYKQMVERNSAKIDSIHAEINKFQKGISDFCKEQAKEANNNLRARMREVINQGIVDGEHLNRSFQENQQYYNEEAFLKTSDLIVDFSDKCRNWIEELEIYTIEFGTISINSFNKQEKMKYEKVFIPAGGVVGGVVGYFVGGLVTAAIEGGAWGSIAGPAGAVVGIAIGVIGGVIGNLLFKESKKSRINITINDLEVPLKEARKTLEELMKKSLEDHCKTLNDTIRYFKEKEERSLEKLYEEAKGRVKSRLESSVEDRERLNMHHVYVINIMEKL